MSSQLPEPDRALDQAQTAIAALSALIDQALSGLKPAVSENGKLSASKLDSHQLACYDIALCWSECTAATFMLSHAARIKAEGLSELSLRLTALFCAET
ncbi:MAG: hypothetical protein GY887_04650, partial [Halieaceae bacterium]|nr:hypothetical protein [Halieaceae bacterium]